MLENADAPIKGVVDGGAEDDGRTIYFDLKLENGQVSRMRCPHHRFGHVLSTLQALAGRAARDRAYSGVSTGSEMDIDSSEPFETKSIRAGVLIGMDLLAIRVETEHELAIDIALTPEQARELIDSLHQMLGKFQPAGSQRVQ